MGSLLNEQGTIAVGGLERYIAEIGQLLSRRGHEVVVYQKASKPFCRRWCDVDVVGLPGSTGVVGDFKLSGRLLRIFRDTRIDLAIYANMLYAFPYMFHPSVGIHHGIWWDHPGLTLAQRWAAELINLRLLQGFDEVISVDTNVINWLRARNPRSTARISYIPNFAFIPEEVPGEPIEPVVLFPRRFEDIRGIRLMAETAEKLLSEGRQVRFDFVGDGSRRRWLESYLEHHEMVSHCRIFSLPPDQMSLAYSDAWVVVIPSTAAEGTSLAAIEAMAHGKALVVTEVGGLGNLVIDGFNGLIVRPQVDALYQAITRLLDDSELRRRLGRNARCVARSFSHQIWCEKIVGVLSRFSV